jgi:V-type H+-transporting ATPase subunit H
LAFRALALILSSSTDHVALAVAAHDIGQYVKFLPQGRKYVDTTGAKQRVMELMTHENGEVRYQALIAVQKYMAHIG